MFASADRPRVLSFFTARSPQGYLRGAPQPETRLGHTYPGVNRCDEGKSAINHATLAATPASDPRRRGGYRRLGRADVGGLATFRRDVFNNWAGEQP
jgi:hypothetical protein